jgi:hypothetical protein
MLPAASLLHAQTGGPQEGIKVHGHWVIEVRNPDGSLATRREFQNALNPVGRRNLAGLLARASSAGRWSIAVIGATPLCPESPSGVCFITESDSVANFSAGVGVSTNLSVTLGGSDSNEVVLSGSVTALQAGGISIVKTDQGVCPGTSAAQACTNGNSAGDFSRSLLNSLLPVQQGQIIQVTVRFSFS